MRRAATTLIVLLMLLVGGAANAAAQGEDEGDEKVTLIDTFSVFDEPHPIFIRIWCEKASCPGLELQITTETDNHSISDSHKIEFSFSATGQVDFVVKADPGTTKDDLWFETSEWFHENTSSMMKESDDWLDNVPSPGIHIEQQSVDPTWDCPIDTCDGRIWTRTHWLVGSLEDGSDKDSVEVFGTAGDFIQMPPPLMPESVELEFWVRNDSSKTLLEPFDQDNDGWYRFEYPEGGDLWLRLKQHPEAEFAAYELYILRYDPELEASWGELSNVWGDREPLQFPPIHLGFNGWISPSDSSGDTIRIESASRMDLFLNCWGRFDSLAFEVFLISADGNSTPVEGEGELCADHITTRVDTVALEFRITSSELAVWSIGVREFPRGDAGAMGDAPDRLWTLDDDSSDWPQISMNESIGARMVLDEYVDVFAFEVTEENGSRLHIDSDTTQPVNYQILILDQESWVIVNSSSGGLINAPPGIHAIRVEVIGESNYHYYDFTLVNGGEITEPEPPVFVDRSDLFIEYYIFAGVFLLAPAALAVFWNRKRWLGGVTEIEMEQHELRRLRRLRERLTAMLAKDETDEQVIDSALHQLGDSPWQAVVADWGEPLLRHNTEQVEICAWRIAEGDATMLLGIRVADSPWELAAMRVHAPEGASVSIGAVSPSHLFMGDEISLDTLAANSRTFLRLTLEGEPSSIGFHLSGLVDGEPLAAVPNRALDWS